MKTMPIETTFEPIEPADDNDDIARLARLSPIDYDRIRDEEAKRRGVRVSTLDAEVKRLRASPDEEESSAGFSLADPDLWSNPVDGADLLDRLAQAVRRHMVLPSGAAEAAALWIVHSHAHDTAAISPILAVTSPTPECGKTTLLTLLLALVRRPLPAANITAAAVFRAVEKWSPTLVIDEADTFLKDSDELRGVLNSGHNKQTAFVIRTTGEDHEPRAFRTWAPKAIALIGTLPPTLESRAVHVELRRIGDGETVEPLRGDRLDALEPLRRQAFTWAQDHANALKRAEPDLPAGLRGRAADNWRHLIAIADEAGGSWPQRARHAAETLDAVRSEVTTAVMLLEDIRAAFDEAQVDRMTSGHLTEALAAGEDRPWPEWKAGRPITPNQLARLLKPFRICPATIRTSLGTAKGYMRTAFDDAFARYLPERNVTPSQPLRGSGLNESQTVTDAEAVTVPKSLEPLRSRACDAVTDQNAEGWAEDL